MAWGIGRYLQPGPAAPAFGGPGRAGFTFWATWTAAFDEADGWLRRASEIPERHIDPTAAVMLHTAAGMLHAGRGKHRSALEEFVAAARAESLLTGAQLAAPLTAWLAATQVRLGMRDEARATLSAFSGEP